MAKRNSNLFLSFKSWNDFHSRNFLTCSYYDDNPSFLLSLSEVCIKNLRTFFGRKDGFLVVWSVGSELVWVYGRVAENERFYAFRISKHPYSQGHCLYNRGWRSVCARARGRRIVIWSGQPFTRFLIGRWIVASVRQRPTREWERARFIILLIKNDFSMF